MLNNILTALYARLRKRSRLPRQEFADRINIGRDTLRKYEAGNTRPDPETERKMVEAAGCSDLELGEILCEIASEELGVRVQVVEDQTGYRPGTPLGNARRVHRQGGDLSESERRALGKMLHSTRLLQVVWERINDDLDEYAADCRANAARRRAAAAISNQGATGPAGVAGPDFDKPRRDAEGSRTRRSISMRSG